MSKIQKVFVLSTLMVLALSAVAATSKYLSILNPEAQLGFPEVVPPLLAPPDTSNYKSLPADSAVASPDGRAVAQLVSRVAGFSRSISVDFPEIGPVDPKEVSFAVLASIRYDGDEGALLITTAKPSDKASTLSMSLGNKQITLANGREAWVYSNPTDKEFPNRVVFTERNLIVTLTGSVSSERLQELASSVAVK